jgi:uncharacterized cupin superfamily protein
MPNFLEPEWDEERSEEPYRWRRAKVGKQAGAEKLGASVFEVEPGAATFPLHAHFANEELLIVLSGAATLLTRDGERELSEGEVVSFPAGEGGAHRIENRSSENIRLLLMSTMLAPEINAMYEDGSYWIRDNPPGADPNAANLNLKLPSPD